MYSSNQFWLFLHAGRYPSSFAEHWCKASVPSTKPPCHQVLLLPPHFLYYSYTTSAVAVPAKLCNMCKAMLIKELQPESLLGSFHASPNPSRFKPGQIEPFRRVTLPHIKSSLCDEDNSRCAHYIRSCFCLMQTRVLCVHLLHFRFRPHVWT